MQAEWTGALVGAAVFTAAGFVSGAMRNRSPRAPRVAVRIVILGYVVLLGTTAAYALSCPSCTSRISYDSTRGADLAAALLWGGFFSLCIIAAVGFGFGASVLASRVLRR